MGRRFSLCFLLAAFCFACVPFEQFKDFCECMLTILCLIFFNVLNTSFVHIILFATCWQSSLFFKYRKLNVLEGENNVGGGGGN